MKDNVSIDLTPSIDEEQFLRELRLALPSFAWVKSGEGAGLNLCTGSDEAGVRIEFRTDRRLWTASVAYYSAWKHEADRESRKMSSIAQIQAALGRFGSIARVVM